MATEGDKREPSDGGVTDEFHDDVAEYREWKCMVQECHADCSDLVRPLKAAWAMVWQAMRHLDPEQLRAVGKSRLEVPCSEQINVDFLDSG